MRKSGPGGVTPFAITTKPNIFTPLSNEELIDRRGESALWYRLSPCPCPPASIVPDCPFCFEGLIRTFQDEVVFQEEVSWKVDGNLVFTRYAPITKVEHATLFSREQQKQLTVKHIRDDHFEVSESLKYWNIVMLRYAVSLVEELVFETVGHNEYALFPKLPMGAIVDVLEVWFVPEDQNESPKPVAFTGFTLGSITFRERVSGKYRVKVKFFNPIKIGYKTFNSNTDARKIFDKSQLQFQDGELMAVVGAGYQLGQGDIITLLISTLRHSEYIAFNPSEFDRLSFSPIRSVDSIISKDRHGLHRHKAGTDFIVFGDSRIQWFSDKPRGGYTIIYDYHPTFRVTGFIEAGSGEDREKPRVFKMKPLPNFNAREQTGKI